VCVSFRVFDILNAPFHWRIFRVIDILNVRTIPLENIPVLEVAEDCWDWLRERTYKWPQKIDDTG
jgi:hypothetical protein